MYKTYIMNIQHDNGADVKRKTAVVMAENRADAFRLVKKQLCTSADDVVVNLSTREMCPDDVVVDI